MSDIINLLKSKFFWLNIIALVILTVQYTMKFSMLPDSWLPLEGLVLVLLNAIAGMLQSQQLSKAKAEIVQLKR